MNGSDDDPPVDPKRSALMARVKGRDTQPELLVRRWLHRAGYRFRLHRRNLPGCPDIVMPRHRIAVFVHGCFWHRHPGCSRASMPRTRRSFWEAKFTRNVERDTVVRRTLEQDGWHVVVVWECVARKPDALDLFLRAALEPMSDLDRGCGE